MRDKAIVSAMSLVGLLLVSSLVLKISLYYLREDGRLIEGQWQMEEHSKQEFHREQSGQKSPQDNKKRINLRQACDALLHGLHISRNSPLGKKLVAGAVDFDEESGIYWIPGELAMNLTKYTFKIYTPETDPRFSRGKRGRFFFSNTGELKAEMTDYH